MRLDSLSAKLPFFLGLAGLVSCTLLNPLEGYTGGSRDPSVAESGATPPGDSGVDAQGATDGQSGDAKYDGAQTPDGGIADATAVPVFFDDFTRADSGTLGRGWAQKTSGVFSIADGKALVQPWNSYRSGLAYRPQSEDFDDVEVAADVLVPRFDGAFPQLHARILRATVDGQDTLDSYLIFANCTTISPRVYIASTRGTGGVESTMQLISLSEPLEESVPFRLRLRVTGQNPVRIEGTVERINGATATVLGQAVWLDSSPSRLSSAGGVGMSNYVSNVAATSPFYYDNFRTTKFVMTTPPL